MPKIKNNEKKENDDVTINLKESSVAEFTKRPVPTNEEVESFEDMIEEKTYDEEFSDNEEMNEEIEESLNEIYQDDKGQMVDVKRINIRRRRGWFFWIFSFMVTVSAMSALAYGFYNYFFIRGGTDATAIEFMIEGDIEVTAGEEYFYTIKYRNNTNVVITDARVEAKFPDNFVYLDSFPEASGEQNNVWEIPSIPAQFSNTIKIKGMMVGPEGDTGVILSSIRYTPANFSSEFKRDAALTTIIKDIGLDFDIDFISTALVGEENEISINFNARENGFINNFRITMEPAENIEFTDADTVGLENLATFKSELPGVWYIEEVTNDNLVLPISFIFTDKTEEKQTVKLTVEQPGVLGKYFTFYEADLEFEVLKSDLNLTLIINGSRDDQGVNFGDTLNYSIVYNNKGETSLKDVIIMAVIESDFLDWTTLSDAFGGREKGNSITWTKNEIPGLEEVKVNQEGTIDLAIKLLESVEPERMQVFQVKSFVQFSVGKIDEEPETKNEDNRSNTIINKINSDLKIKESLRYFNEDNIPVGTGPHPPKVGEQSTYKVYWELQNNLHELNDLQVSVILPENVTWDSKERSTVGAVEYNSGLNAIIWDVGRLPITVYEASAEFSISVTPTEENKNKIMVLMPGTKVSAIDAETEAELVKTTKAKTTKLEDDEIANGDGIVN